MGSVNGLLRIASTLPKEHPESPVLELSDVFVGGDRMEYISGRKPVLKIPEQSRTITIKVKAHNKIYSVSLPIVTICKDMKKSLSILICRN